MRAAGPACTWGVCSACGVILEDKQRGPTAGRGRRPTLTLPNSIPPRSRSDSEGAGGRENGQSLLGAGGHGQDPPRPALLLLASENLSLSSKLVRPEPAGRAARGPLPNPTLKSTDLTWSDHGGNIWTSHRAHGKTARQGVCSRV